MTGFAYGRTVRCPICADTIPWEDDGRVSLFNPRAEGGIETIDISGLDPAKRADFHRQGYRQCPNPSHDTAEHFLPATYADYDEPLVIGLVGATRSGKTHLLTAMIREAHRGGLSPLGVRVTPLDFRRHERFQREFIALFEAGTMLAGTGRDVIEAADILLVRGNDRARPVVFFDLAGEDYTSSDVLRRSSRFLVGADALIFVHAAEDPAARDGRAPDSPFDLAVERVLAARSGEEIPAAIVLNKADRLRYIPPADRWLRKGGKPELTLADIRAESRDVYAYMHREGARGSLSPYDAFARCTLHFVSASGGDAQPLDGFDDGRASFRRGVRPMRVLQPLSSILAMCGLVPGVDADLVGRW